MLDDIILNKLNKIKNNYSQLDTEITNLNYNKDKLKEYSRLGKIIEIADNYEQTVNELVSTKKLYNEATDTDWREICEQECDKLKNSLNNLEQQLQEALIEKDPEDDYPALFEISGEVGGAEAELFASDLANMYFHYMDKNNYKVEVLDEKENNLGGYSYISFRVTGDNAYGTFKYESGIHRVQRVPETEAKGRLHTSTAAVMVTPEIPQEKFNLNLDDVDITTCHASGAGGQHINKTSSAIRAIYKPTGLTVFCQSRRSQLENKEEALRILASKLKAEQEEKSATTLADNKKLKVGNANRSEKIRTYNYPQNRVTDHRINYSELNLNNIMLGDMNNLLTALHIEANKEKE